MGLFCAYYLSKNLKSTILLLLIKQLFINKFRSLMQRFTQKLFLTVLCAAQIATNTFGMEKEQILLPEKQGTTTLNKYLNELEDIEEGYAKHWHPYWKEERLPLYQKNTQALIKKIMNWIQSTQEHIDINTISKKGNTLLYHVIKNASDREEKNQPSHVYAFTQYLLEYNANPNIQNNDGKTAFWHCMWNCLERFNFQNYYKLHQKEMFKSLIQLFLTHNANPNVSSPDGGLCLLAEREYSEIVQEILTIQMLKPLQIVKIRMAILLQFAQQRY